MSELTDWINYELYPSLFDVIPQALQEKIERWEKKNGPVKEPKK